jgi:general secretion pathway protein C
MLIAKTHSAVSTKVLHGVTFCVWALVLFSAVYWGLKWMGSAQQEVSVSSVGKNTLEVSALSATELQRALGEQSAPALTPMSAQELQAQQMSLLNSRVRLVGVVAAQTASASASASGRPKGVSLGVALLSLDQQAPKPFKVGDEVEAGLYVLSLESKSVSLGPSREGPATLRLVMPEPKGL